ncbi:MAG: AAA family ATPase [Lactobacillales bacterium]|jgi:chromosome partitioning protein|nr:AAA family ATPase [Lactobacillales bacterium]
MAKIVAIANQKGGVGKTTTTINLGACLAGYGKRVLLVDLDSQGNATTGIGIQKGSYEQSMFDVIADGVSVKNIILDTCREGLFVAPASIDIAGLDQELGSELHREKRVKIALEEVRDDYDYILMDCPPALGLLTINAFTAADSVLIPVQCEFYALEGLGQLLNSIRLVQKAFNPDLQVEGVVPTMYNNTNLADDVINEIRGYFTDKLYDTVISRNIKISEAPSHGLSIIDYDPSARGAQEYILLAQEFLKRNGEKI